MSHLNCNMVIIANMGLHWSEAQYITEVIKGFLNILFLFRILHYKYFKMISLPWASIGWCLEQLKSWWSTRKVLTPQLSTTCIYNSHVPGNEKVLLSCLFYDNYFKYVLKNISRKVAKSALEPYLVLNKVSKKERKGYTII